MRHSNHWEPKHVKQRKFYSFIEFLFNFIYQGDASVCLFDHVQTATLCHNVTYDSLICFSKRNNIALN